MQIKMCALVSSRQELQKSLSFASIRPLQQKLLQVVVARSDRVSYPGFLGITPWFLAIKMLRSLFQMTAGSNSNGRIDSDDNNKENQSDDNNNENEMSTASDPKELASSLSNPEEQGDDDGTTDTGDPLLPRQIFCPSDASMPSSTPTAPRMDLHQPRQSATVRGEVAEDPNQPYMNCTSALIDVNLLHVKQEEQELGDDGDSCASAAEFADLGDATEEALQDRLFLLGNNEVDEMGDTRENSVMLQKGFSKEIKITSTPPDFKPKAPNESKGQPSFSNVDNPGNWSEYTFRPEFAKKDKGGNYTGHTLPTGAVPVPIKDGKREAGGWEFHYTGWKATDSGDNVVPSKVERHLKTCFLRRDRGALMRNCLKNGLDTS